MTTLLADAVTRTSTGEAVLFWILAVVALIGALGMVMASKAVYSAMFLAMTMIVLAVFYVAQDALFLGVVQVVVRDESVAHQLRSEFCIRAPSPIFHFGTSVVVYLTARHLYGPVAAFWAARKSHAAGFSGRRASSSALRLRR